MMTDEVLLTAEGPSMVLWTIVSLKLMSLTPRLKVTKVDPRDGLPAPQTKGHKRLLKTICCGCYRKHHRVENLL